MSEQKDSLEHNQDELIEHRHGYRIDIPEGNTAKKDENDLKRKYPQREGLSEEQNIELSLEDIIKDGGARR